MENVNQPQENPADGGQQAKPQQSEQMDSGYQATQPQPGGFYQFQPGAGFVQVQGPTTQTGASVDPTMTAQPGMGQATMDAQPGMSAPTMDAQPGMGAADATAQAGVFSQAMPDGAEPKFDQQKLGKIYSTVNDVINGDADPTSLIGLFAENSGDFWKGALVGAAAVVLLNNDAVKGALAGVAGSVGAMFGDSDPEGEQVTVGGK